MVIRHETPHYSYPPAMMSNNNSMHQSYYHSGHHMHQPSHNYDQPRYYAPPPHHPSPREHHQPSSSNAQSPSHHAAVTLQSMQHYHPHGYARVQYHQSHGLPASPSPKSSATIAPSHNSNIEIEQSKAEGFNMLIAAATSESMNSIDEEEKVQDPSAPTAAAKGILKKHPRGKQLVSPLEKEEKVEKEVDSVKETKKENVKEETQSSAGPLKKRRKMEGETADNAASSLLKKLHRILSEESSEAATRALEWLEHGKAFRVLRWDALADKVLPELFSDKDMEVDALIYAFRGQLKDCGFVEVKRGKDYGSYCHEFFVKDQPEQIDKITVTANRSDVSPTYDIAQSGSSLDGGMEWRSTRRVAHSIFKLPRTEEENEGAPRVQSHPSYLHMPVLTTTTTASFAENCGSNEDRRNEHHHHHHSRHHRSHLDIHFQHPYLPHQSPRRTESKEEASGRSPKIIRFRVDEEAARSHSRMMRGRYTGHAIEISPNDAVALHEREAGGKKLLEYDTVQITPNPEYEQANRNAFKPHFPVSKRGGRGGGNVMRPVASRQVRHTSS